MPYESQWLQVIPLRTGMASGVVSDDKPILRNITRAPGIVPEVMAASSTVLT